MKTSLPEPLEPIITEKRRNKTKYLVRNSLRCKFVKKNSMLNSVESPKYIKCYSSSSTRPVKNLSSSERYDCQKFCSWSGRPKTILTIRKKVTFLEAIKNSIIYEFFKDFPNHRRTTNRAVVFNRTPSPNILKYRDHRWDLSIIWKTRFLQIHIEEFILYMYKNSGSHFFRTTAGKQSGPDVFGKSSLVMTFITSLKVTEIFCSFKLVLEGKTGKERLESSRSEFIEKFLANDFALSDAEGNISGSLNERGIANLSLLKTLLAIRQKLFCFISICKFGSFKDSFATITSLSKLCFRYKRFILLLQTGPPQALSHWGSKIFQKGTISRPFKAISRKCWLSTELHFWFDVGSPYQHFR